MPHILRPIHTQQCSDLHKQCFEKSWSYTEFSDLFDNDLNITFGVWDKDNLVGLLSCMMLGTEAEIYTLCVHPDYRHKNIASHLIQTTQQECRNRLITDIFLEVSVDNHAAIKCYEKNNFKIITIRKNYYTVNSVPIDAYLMRFDGV